MATNADLATYSERFIRDQFYVIEKEGMGLLAAGRYWNQGVCGIAVALVFETNGTGPDEDVYAWKAYIGATVAADGFPQHRHIAIGDMGTEQAVRHARRHGVKLSEGEARVMFSDHAEVLGALAYYR